MTDLSVELAGIRLQNPVLVASGTFGTGEEFAPFCDPRCLGAIVTKTVTLEPRPGNPPPRLWETPAGLLNAVGLQNPGVEAFVVEVLPRLKRYGVPVIASIGGASLEEYVAVARRLEGSGIAALELNISCPNVERGGMALGTDPEAAAAVVAAVVRATDLPVFVKLTPNVTDIAAVARAVAAAGAHGLALINTLLGMAIDVEARRPALGNVFGGLSGPAIRPVAVRAVWQVAGTVSLPIIGMGGICTGKDALEFILAGATAVAVGSALFRDPRAPLRVLEEITAYCRRHGVARLADLVGAARREGGPCS